MKDILIPATAFLFSSISWAQKPTEVPKPSDYPIDLSNTADLIIYIIIPIVFVVLILWWRKRQKQNK
ncbi:adenylosuccinate synthetase [Aequorivita sediminis]|uniref:adenylosuccinate synthetase n=1 Tax=Aequorivita sediminis TaxID=3073653 RepID=UPI0028AA4817|nr:adenylosuccinate synthetase [Aequorivita sp. F6058]